MRKPTWDSDLMKFIRSREKTPFAWGVHDCTLFAADCAQVVTGQDPAAKYRGTYSDQAGAAKIIKASGGSLRQLVTANMGTEISPNFAQRGDWILIEQDGSEALAVCMGAMMVAAGRAGLVLRRMADAIAAWRVA